MSSPVHLDANPPSNPASRACPPRAYVQGWLKQAVPDALSAKLPLPPGGTLVAYGPPVSTAAANGTLNICWGKQVRRKVGFV